MRASAAPATCSSSTRTRFESVLRVERHRGVPDGAGGDLRICYERRGAIVTYRLGRRPAGGDRRASPTASSKAALAMLTQCIALDHGPAGVRANCLCPGWVRTPMADRAMDWLAERAARRARMPTRSVDGRTCRCGDRARPRRSQGRSPGCLSEDASYVNGAVIPVDGGVLDRSTSATLAFEEDADDRPASPSPASRSRRTTTSAASASPSASTFTDVSPIDEQPLGEIARGGAARGRPRRRRRDGRRSRPGRPSAPRAAPSTSTGSPT